MLSISNFLSDFFKEFQSSTVSEDKEKINKLINQITGEGTPNKKIVSIRVVGGLKKESDNKEILIDYSANKKNNKSTYIRQFYSPNEI